MKKKNLKAGKRAPELKRGKPVLVQRMALLRLARAWRKEAEIFRRDLGACIAGGDRAQVTASFRKLEYCAAGLERLAQ